MPRKSRRQLAGKAEDVARAESERRFGRLEKELHKEQEATEETGDTPIPPDEDDEGN